MRLKHIFPIILILTGFVACDESFHDAIPDSFREVEPNPDEVFMINSGDELGVRLDPLLNDTIKVDVSISYSTPASGAISFVQNEGWFYKPESDFFGTDNFSYTLCYQDKCSSAKITMHVEEPYNPDTCEFAINGESVETTVDTPIEIRIFANDVVCPYMGSSINAPEKGTFKTYSYSGSFKNIVYVYYPPKGYTGTDRFKYKLFTNGMDLEAYCNITIK